MSSTHAVPLCAAALLLFAAALPAVAQTAGPEPTRVPVLLELFTSEGCSSCPTADALVLRLLAEQPVPGALVVALSEHVDYWNRLGWRDPFSDPLFSARQEAYAPLAAGRVYTPQVVVGGSFAVPGNDPRSVREALAAAAAQPHGTVALQVRREGDKSITVTARAEGLPQEGTLFVALVEDGLSVRVTAGENEGRTLPHAAVVRALRMLGESKAGSARGEARLLLEAAWSAERLRVVAFVQRPAGAVQAVGAVKVLP
jgi:hypothetical protein